MRQTMNKGLLSFGLIALLVGCGSATFKEAVVLQSNRQYNGAVDAYEGLLEDSDTPEETKEYIHGNLGDIYLERAKYDEAIEHYNAALDMRPSIWNQMCSRHSSMATFVHTNPKTSGVSTSGSAAPPVRSRAEPIRYPQRPHTLRAPL